MSASTTQSYPICDMSPYAMLLRLEVNELRRKYMPRPPRVPLGQQHRMLPGAPEAEQDALLGRAG